MWAHRYMGAFGCGKRKAWREERQRKNAQRNDYCADRQRAIECAKGTRRTSAAISTSSLAALDTDLRSRIALRSLSSLRLMTTTLLGWMPIGAVEPLDLSRWTRSTWITHFFL